MAIPFIDLQAQRRHLEPKVTKAINCVLERGDFIQGQEVHELEALLSAFTGARNVVTCANGTDALTLVGMAENIGVGDAVFVPSFTFVATAEAFIVLGATPYFIDVLPDTFNMDPESLKAGIADAKKQGLRPRFIVSVDLFGQPADYNALSLIASENNIVLVADAAQALGASFDGTCVGTLADYTTTSFFPAKPLGCYGDGGAVLTDDAEKAALIKSLSQHGKGQEKYDNVRVGLNSRLDTLQAAVLIEKLRIFPDEITARNRIAAYYTNALQGVVETPVVMADATSCWAQYTIKVPERKVVQDMLKNAGIPSAIYYPMPLNQQGGYAKFPSVPGGVPVSERLSRQVLSLPMHAYLESDIQNIIVEAVRDAIGVSR